MAWQDVCDSVPLLHRREPLQSGAPPQASWLSVMPRQHPPAAYDTQKEEGAKLELPSHHRGTGHLAACRHIVTAPLISGSMRPRTQAQCAPVYALPVSRPPYTQEAHLQRCLHLFLLAQVLSLGCADGLQLLCTSTCSANGTLSLCCTLLLQPLKPAGAPVATGHGYVRSKH